MITQHDIAAINALRDRIERRRKLALIWRVSWHPLAWIVFFASLCAFARWGSM